MTKLAKRIIIGVVLFGFVLMFGLVWLVLKSGFFDYSTEEEKPLVFQGMALHSALWYYDADHGRLPAKLTDLVPKYAKQVDINAPKPYSGGPMFRIVNPERPTSERRMNGDLLVSVPIQSASRKEARLVYVQEDGDVIIRQAPD